jgi:dTDP-glucose 4,6-dehydratase
MRPNDGRVVPAFIHQALENKPITAFGDGHQTRSFCYVSDLIDGIYRLAMSKETGPINIGNPKEMTVLQMAQKIIQITKSKSKIVFRPLPVDDPKVRQPNIALARKLLQWEPKVSLDQGLPLTIQYFRSLKR